MPASLRVEIHHDFALLEQRLEHLLRTLKQEEGPLAPAAIVVPTSRLRTHLQERLAGRLGTLVEVHFFHHDGLALAAASSAAAAGTATASFPRPLGDAAREAILGAAAAKTGGAIARWLEAVPSGIGALLATIDDLREAGVRPDAARRVGGLSDEARALLALHAEYVATLDRMLPHGFADRAGRIAAAIPFVPRFASRFRRIVHYGAYDLVGMNLDLLRAVLESGSPVVCLAPGHPRAPAFAYARSFWREAFGAEPVLLPDAPADRNADGAAGAGRLLGRALPRLYDEEAGHRLDGEVRFFHAQGSAGELREAALEALGDHAAHGTPARRIAVLARSLDPYAARLADLSRTHALALTTSATTPLAAEAPALAALLLLRAVLLDFPSRALVDLARGGRLLAPPGTEPAAAVDAWERILRHHRVEGGLAILTTDLPRWVEEDPPAGARRPAAGSEADAARRRAFVGHAVHLGRLVRALERESAALRASGDWPGFAAAARSLLERRLAGFDGGDAADPATRGVLTAVDDLEALGAAGLPFESSASGLAALERAVAAARAPLDAFLPDGTPGEADAGGVRVFDMMQARGLWFDTVVLLGLNAAQTPRPARPDPFLPDADRARLRAALGRPVPIKEEARLEEHLLLALTLGSARRRLVVGWQRADDSGRALSSSLALREIARVTKGTPDLALLLREADRVPGDLRAWGESGPASLLPPGEALLASALAAGSPAALLPRLGALAALLPGGPGALAAGLEHLGALEGPEDRGFDALVGPPEAAAVDPAGSAPGTAPAPRPWSPSRLEMLGACPQRYFFHHLLFLEEWDETAEAHEIDPREIGSAVHDVLARVYEAALAQGPPTAPAAAADEVRAAWRAATARIAGRLDPIYPGLWEQIGGAWREAIVRFVERDLPPLRSDPGRVLCEASVEAALPVPGRETTLNLGGRFDRVFVRGDGRVVVTDYKTGGRLDDFVSPREFLKGRRLQMPLYALMAKDGRLRGSGDPMAGERASIDVEVLGVGPRFEREPQEARAVLEAAALDAARDGFLETLAVLLRLGDAGLYPLNETSPSCLFCGFHRACRRGHPATLERLATNPALRDYALVRRKSARARLLAQVAGDAGNADEP